MPQQEMSEKEKLSTMREDEQRRYIEAREKLLKDLKEAPHIVNGVLIERKCYETGCEADIHRETIKRLEEENSRLKTLLGQLGEGVLLIAMERQRQVVEEGWTPEHDDQHKHGEMCAAAAVYAFTPRQRFQVHASQFWPWDMKWFKPGNRIRELQKAGALIAAEIDRLKRRTADATAHDLQENNWSIPEHKDEI